MELTPLTALSPLDGRYAEQTAALRHCFSEFGLMRARYGVEVAWLKFQLQQVWREHQQLLLGNAWLQIENSVEKFSVSDALEIKNLEKVTNHDVKAVEYFLKQQLQQHAEFTPILEFIHFACTSEDINNLAYAQMFREGRSLLLQAIDDFNQLLRKLALEHAKTPMLARTHGQPASPTTLGKELSIFVSRVARQQQRILSCVLEGKFNGATGNFNAHVVALPQHDWLALSQAFVESLGLSWNPFTTQIEPHDFLVSLLQEFDQLNHILVGLCRDFWRYISINYLRSKTLASEVGSSTMPHKVNPIDFENAEGNLRLSIGLFRTLTDTLPITRWQRDLVDSTLMRNVGMAFGYSMVAYKSILRGLSKIEVNVGVITTELQQHPEVLAEAIQTVMRAHGIPDSYEKLKQLTRGNTITQTALMAFIEALPLDDVVKKRLLFLTPENYIGLASEICQRAVKSV